MENNQIKGQDLEWTISHIAGRNGSDSFYQANAKLSLKTGANMNVLFSFTPNEVDLVNLLTDNAFQKIPTGTKKKFKITTNLYQYKINNEERYVGSLLIVIKDTVKKFIRFNKSQNEILNLSIQKSKTDPNWAFAQVFNEVSEKEVSDLTNTIEE